MKKVFPILPYLDDDDFIVNMDDDILMPSEFLQSRLDDFQKYHGKCAISSGKCGKMNVQSTVTGLTFTGSSQPASLMTKRMLGGYEIFYGNQDV